MRLNFVRDRAVGSARNGLLMLMAAAVLFMLVGCSNVANLLLARGRARQMEIAVRLAIGAGTGRIVRQILTESCVLALLGGLGGYVLAAASWKILPALAPVSIPRLTAARADSAIFGFTLALAVLNGILFGMAPALRLAREQAISLSGFGTHGVAAGGRDRMRSSLVVAEVAFAVVLVVTGGALLGSFYRLIATDPGFEKERVLASVVLPAPERYKDPEQRGLFYRRILNSVRALPGVASAGTVDALPFSGENNGGIVSRGEGPDATPLVSEIDVAGGEYLQTMGIRLMEGRWFHDDEMSPSNGSAIVSTFAARRLWPQASAIGQRICVYCTPENPRNFKRVIGVVSNARHAAFERIGEGQCLPGCGSHAEVGIPRGANETVRSWARGWSRLGIDLSAFAAECARRARGWSSRRCLDRSQPGNSNRWNRVLDSSAASYQDEPDFRASAGIDRDMKSFYSRSGLPAFRCSNIHSYRSATIGSTRVARRAGT